MSPDIRVATADDVSWMLDLAAAEGWNPGLEDAEAFRRADPDGFFVSYVDGAPAACISVVNHSLSFAFLGLYICAPALRGQGIGFALWQAALEHAGTRTVGLDGVPDQQANYTRSGFSHAGETYRYVGRPDAGPQDGIELADADQISGLVQLATGAFGYVQEAFLTGWFQQTSTRRTYRNEDASAFYTVRRCKAGCKIGPLIAPDVDTAARLIAHCAARHPNDDLVIDVPDDCPDLAAHCLAQGMEVSFNTARMYRGEPPKAGPTLRSIATLELG